MGPSVIAASFLLLLLAIALLGRGVAFGGEQGRRTAAAVRLLLAVILVEGMSPLLGIVPLVGGILALLGLPTCTLLLALGVWQLLLAFVLQGGGAAVSGTPATRG